MSNTDHIGKHKIQCWIPESLWDKVASLNIPNQTIAVTKALELLVSDSENIPNSSQDIPRLEATIQGLQLLLQEKDERIFDLKRETETLNTFAHYFKSLEYRRLEQGSEEPKPKVHEHRDVQTSAPRSTPAGRSEKEIIKKICKNCGEEFDTVNPKKETCSDKCRSAYSRKRK